MIQRSSLLSGKSIILSIAVLALGLIGTSYWPDFSISTEEIVPFKFSMSTKPISVFVLGATGEVGKEVVKELAKHAQIDRVVLIGRRKLDIPSDDPNYKKFNQTIIDFDDLPKYSDAFKGFDAGVCALGTTRGKSGAAGFYKVDHDYVVNTARLAKEGGCKHFNLISSGGANKDTYFPYLKVKGQVEHEITEMEFDRLSIFRPAVLLCKRTETRLVELALQGVLTCLDRWRVFSIDVPILGRGVVNNLFKIPSSKVEILDNSVCKSLGNANDN